MSYHPTVCSAGSTGVFVLSLLETRRVAVTSKPQRPPTCHIRVEALSLVGDIEGGGDQKATAAAHPPF